LKEGEKMIKWISAFFNYLNLLPFLKDDGITGLEDLKAATDVTIQQLKRKQTSVERALPEIESIMTRYNISRYDVIKALKQK
jgi:hypothetical protein